MIWEFARLYILSSLAIGLISTAVLLFVHRRELFLDDVLERVKINYLEKLVQADHVQKEVYGKRVVYYGKDVVGIVYLDAASRVTNMDMEKKCLHVAFLLVAGTIRVSIFWPKLLYRYLLP
jgi:hypothetical protein